MSTAGLVVEELDVEHIVALPVTDPLASMDLHLRCINQIAQIQMLLAESRALRAWTCQL